MYNPQDDDHIQFYSLFMRTDFQKKDCGYLMSDVMPVLYHCVVDGAKMSLASYICYLL